jgi:hypothetical protein
MQIRELLARSVIIAKCLEDTHDGGKMKSLINHEHMIQKILLGSYDTQISSSASICMKRRVIKINELL